MICQLGKSLKKVKKILVLKWKSDLKDKTELDSHYLKLPTVYSNFRQLKKNICFPYPPQTVRIMYDKGICKMYQSCWILINHETDIADMGLF